MWTPHPQWELVGGLRGDYWRESDGFRRDTPPPAGVPPHQHFADIDKVALSPRVAALFHATPSTDLRASAYQGFRVPTINELYRVFRVRNDVTVANAQLDPERLTGGELGLQQRLGPFQGRITGFWNDVSDLVANVTLARALPDCPAGTTCRQRQNLDLANNLAHLLRERIMMPTLWLEETAMVVYAFDVDETLEVSKGPVKLFDLVKLREQGHIVGLCGNWAMMTLHCPDWHHICSFVGPCGIEKDDFLRQLRQYIPGHDYVMVGNILGISGASDDRGAAERAGWRFIQESEFAKGVR